MTSMHTHAAHGATEANLVRVGVRVRVRVSSSPCTRVRVRVSGGEHGEVAELDGHLVVLVEGASVWPQCALELQLLQALDLVVVHHVRRSAAAAKHARA